MIAEIAPGFYQLQVPFPNNPLRNINCYIIKADGRALMVDTGVNLDECYRAVINGLQELNVDLTRTDFFITHMHTDHIGLLSKLATDGSVVYFNRVDAAVIDNARSGNWMTRVINTTKNGFPKDDILATANHPMYQFREYTRHDFHFLKQDDAISIGDYQFRCIETPGHTKGHMCLYEPNKKLLLSGDHILLDVSPNISTWSATDNPLADYLSSLDKVYKLDVQLVLPAHRRIFNDLKGRVNELEHHHAVRAAEALSILGAGGQNAYQVAQKMTWDLTYKNWAEIPVVQRMFATGETLAHLKYLEAEGKIVQKDGGQEIIFSLR